MTALYVLMGIVALVVIAVISIYNRIIALKQARGNAFADIDVQLKQRTDLVPNLVETVKGYATHEKGVFEEVTSARSRAMHAGNNIAERGAAESQMSKALMNLLAVAENYPDLKANQNFMSLQRELSDLENKIAAARRYFNNATAEYNTAIQTFPAVIIARQFRFQPEIFLEFAEEERQSMQQAPKVAFG